MPDQDIPPETRRNALRYVQWCSQGDRRLLVGYQPGQSRTAAMTAELLYSRMLLGQKPDNDALADATDFIAEQGQRAANPGNETGFAPSQLAEGE